MENQTIAASTRVHPLVAGAAVSVILVSLLGVAAITGVLPSSHGTMAPVASGYPSNVPAASSTSDVQSVRALSGNRYLTQDGQILEAVSPAQSVTPVSQVKADNINRGYEPAPVVHRRKPVRHYAQNTTTQSAPPAYVPQQPAYVPQQPAYAPQQRPVQNYVSDMHPVGTGIGAVAGGLLGNQVGGGNGKKLATVAGVLLGGYAGNEVAHNRNPLPW